MARQWNFEQAVKALGEEFSRRGMMDHVALLRRFWTHWKKGRPRGPDDWGWEIVVEWLGMLRIPPLNRVYPLHPGVSTICPECETISDPETPSAIKIRRWAGGSMIECQRCKACWLTDSAWETAKAGLAARR
jgi:hypothetical protein